MSDEHEPITYTSGDPTIRIRIAHTHTVKDGWRTSETTVEWVGPVVFQHWIRIEDELAVAFALGKREAKRRNAEDMVPS